MFECFFFFFQSDVVLCALEILYMTLKGFLKEHIFSVSQKLKLDVKFLAVLSPF